MLRGGADTEDWAGEEFRFSPAVVGFPDGVKASKPSPKNTDSTITNNLPLTFVALFELAENLMQSHCVFAADVARRRLSKAQLGGLVRTSFANCSLAKTRSNLRRRKTQW